MKNIHINDSYKIWSPLGVEYVSNLYPNMNDDANKLLKEHKK